VLGPSYPKEPNSSLGCRGRQAMRVLSLAKILRSADLLVLRQELQVVKAAFGDIAQAHSASYREAFHLKADYPALAPNYAAQRSELAMSLGLGRKPKGGGTAKEAWIEARAAAA
jgi:hypothetical protein